MNLFDVILPELILVIAAGVLFLLGISSKVAARKLSAGLALLAVVVAMLVQAWIVGNDNSTLQGGQGTIEVGPFANYVKLITGIVGVMMVLLAWPTNRQATGSRSLDFGADAGEFYGLMLLALAGVMLVASSNDLMLLFLGIELASIPTYILVAMSRPLPVAQEAGVKYFFLGAMAAAIMLFGFSYLYGTTGTTKLTEMRVIFAQAHVFTQWQVLAVCIVLAGLAFKIAAVPLHVYVGDVYQGAATPVTAFLAFVPKTSGFVAIVKILMAVGGATWRVPEEVINLLWIVAALTMTVGNTLGLLQYNIKRVFAYSSIAHSGYMLVGITALVAAGNSSLAPGAVESVQREALGGVLFYLAAYGIMNVGAFGVLMLLPSRDHRHEHGPVGAKSLPATSAETYEDIAGVGRAHIGLAGAMAVCCFSLIGMPMTIGFFGKLYLAQPALAIGTSKMNWLVVILAVNAAIGAAYYLRIVATMFLRPEILHVHAPGHAHDPSAAPGSLHSAPAPDHLGPWWANPIGYAIVASVALTLLFGTYFSATNRLADRSIEAARTLPAEQILPSSVPTLSSAQP